MRDVQYYVGQLLSETGMIDRWKRMTTGKATAEIKEYSSRVNLLKTKKQCVSLIKDIRESQASALHFFVMVAAKDGDRSAVQSIFGKLKGLSNVGGTLKDVGIAFATSAGFLPFMSTVISAAHVVDRGHVNEVKEHYQKLLMIEKRAIEKMKSLKY